MADKEHGFMDLIKDGLGIVTQMITASVLSPIAESADVVIKNVEERILRVEKRIMRKLYSLMIIGFGLIVLNFSLFFFLTEYLAWSKTIASLSIGIILLVTGLLLKIGEPDK